MISSFFAYLFFSAASGQLCPMCFTAEQIGALARQQIEGRSVGVFGEAQVNVLRLNLALQRTYPGR